MKRGKEQISRADLLQAIHNSSDIRVRETIAQQLNLKYSSTLEFESVTVEEKISIELANKELTSKINKTIDESQTRPAKGFWYLNNREQSKLFKLSKASQLNQKKQVVWRNKPTEKPKYLLLATPHEIVSLFLPYFYEQGKGRNVDVARLVKNISQGEPIKKLTRQSKKHKISHVHIIDDRHSHLTPYWLDNEAVSYCLQAYYQDIQHTRSILLEGEQIPRQATDYELDNWQIPARQSTVVILSDLGALAPSTSQQVNIWLKIGRELQHQKCNVVVLLPCERNQCDPRFKSLFHLESWQASSVMSEGSAEISLQVEYLLTFLAPSIRLEPGLIRQMRLSLLSNDKFTQNGRFSIAIESLLWQHPAIQERHSVASTWEPTKRKFYLEAFEQLKPKQQTKALQVIRSWRGGNLSHQVWFEEVSSLSSAVQKLDCIRQDVEDVSTYFQQLSVQSESKRKDVPQARLSWFKRLESRMPDSSIEQSIDLQRISHFIHKDEPNFQAKNIDPRNLPPGEKPVEQGVLIQQGKRLYLLPYIIKDGVLVVRIEGFITPLGLIRLRSSQVQVKLNNNSYGSFLFGDKKPIKLPGEGELTVISDTEVLRFSLLSIVSQSAIQRTKNIARDQYGLYTDLSVNNITQRFRYIEPGSFLMGSPEDEAEREPWNESIESQHQVILTEGFWLADTTVTQALYRAVMNENPSHFTDNLNNPVERVSWDGAQQFIEKLNEIIPALHARLPSEAQWEYACRAGTTSPFSLGDNITTEQVNFQGDYPYADGKKGLYREKTVAVKSLPANPWGLYEMHGNVWEWCEDYFQQDLGNKPVTDPFVEKVGVHRVLRGGSWDGDGGGVRSAFRDGSEPGNRGSRTGFRLSLGLELQTGQEQSGSQQVKSRRDGASTPAGGQGAEEVEKTIFTGLKNLFNKDK